MKINIIIIEKETWKIVQKQEWLFEWFNSYIKDDLSLDEDNFQKTIDYEKDSFMIWKTDIIYNRKSEFDKKFLLGIEFNF